MTHSWTEGSFEIAPDLFINQKVIGGPNENPNSAKYGELVEEVDWILYNEANVKIFRSYPGNRGRYMDYGGYIMRLPEEQAVHLLRTAGYEVKPGTVGVCNTLTYVVGERKIGNKRRVNCF